MIINTPDFSTSNLFSFNRLETGDTSIGEGWYRVRFLAPERRTYSVFIGEALFPTSTYIRTW